MVQKEWMILEKFKLSIVVWGWYSPLVDTSRPWGHGVKLDLIAFMALKRVVFGREYLWFESHGNINQISDIHQAVTYRVLTTISTGPSYMNQTSTREKQCHEDFLSNMHGFIPVLWTVLNGHDLTTTSITRRDTCSVPYSGTCGLDLVILSWDRKQPFVRDFRPFSSSYHTNPVMQHNLYEPWCIRSNTFIWNLK